uniref:Terpene synthase metal-binding domain-containing protein n=1 Tax=Brassica campestris TaxID=3711 RepID=M4EE68_BRACM
MIYRSCFASTNPNSLPKFLVSKFHGTVASSSPANTTKRSSPSNFNLPVSNYLRRFDHKISIKHPRQEEWIQNDLQNDVKGLIELYEASELGVEGEEILDSLRECTFTRLNELCSGRDSHEEREIMNSLAQPRHKTLRRLTSNKFISIIKIGGEEDNEWLQSLLRVAECDSIMLKSLIREEIPQAFKAEEGKKLATEMAYMVPGILQEPCFSEQRLDLTKPISLVYIIDDIFDVYGELDELTIFTQVVESGLICSERSWSKQNGLIRVTYQILRSNGFVSSGVHLVMLHVYYLLGEEITTGKVELIESIPKIVSSAATILRLWDDLGSAKVILN